MSRRRQLSSQPTVSLFPFLAVLICTMGTLIVLLVVVVQQAQNTGPLKSESDPLTGESALVSLTPESAMDLPQPAVAELPIVDSPIVEPVAIVAAAPVPNLPPGPPLADEDSLTQLEDVRWANELLAKSREDTLRDLEESRLNLSRVEDQIRTLSEKIGLLETQAQTLLDDESANFAPAEQTEVALENLKLQLATAKKTLTDRQAKAKQYKKQYAILPYEGPNGTRRRPIYIECLPDAVVIQPEGIRFAASDFAVSGSDSPLAATLRAYREYLSNAGLVKTGGEPYPLIIVRPNGERAYTACRNKMRSWEDDYGYELVPADMELAFPPADSGLAAFLNEALADARLRMPSQIASGGGGRRGNSGNSSTGSAGIAVGPGMINPANSGNPPNRTQGNGSSGNGSSGNGAAFAAAASDAKPKGAPTYSIGRGAGGGLVPNGASPARPVARSRHGGVSSRRRELVNGVNRANGRVRNAAGSLVGRGFSGGASVAGAQGEGTENGRTTVASANGPADSQTGSGKSGGSSKSAGANPGGANPGGNMRGGGATKNGSAAGQSGGQSGAAGAMSNGGSPSVSAGGDLSAADADAPPSVRAGFSSIAETQGVDWALPNAADGSIGISRPIAANCEADRIIIKTDRGNVAVPLKTGSVGEAVDPIVTKVWGVIDSWGIAGAGVYWKPTIHVRVKPGAEDVFNELTALLHDSGLVIQRRN